MRSQKGFAPVILILILVILGGGGYWLWQNKSSAYASFESRKENNKQVLYGIRENGEKVKAGLEVVYEWPGFTVEVNFVVSPDKKNVLFNTWNKEFPEMLIFVSAIDGSGKKMIAKQGVPEGSGGLDVRSLGWIDKTHIEYKESAVTCGEGEDCNSPGDFRNGDFHYIVNIETGQKTEVK